LLNPLGHSERPEGHQQAQIQRSPAPTKPTNPTHQQISIVKLPKHHPSLLAAIAGLALLSPDTTRAAEAVISNPAATTIGVVTGGDPGEGLDLSGTFVYGIAVGADPDLNVKIGDVTFLGQQIGDEVPGATLEAGNRILNWYNVNYGDSQADADLKAATSSIRWSQAGSAIPQITLTLENLEVGVQYKFQMVFGEQCCNRGFDVLFDDALVVKDFNPGVAHERIGEGTKTALITHTYTAKAKTVVLRFDGTDASTDYPDRNAILNAVTVEKLAPAVDTDKDGMPDSWETEKGFNPNDPSDAALDFDKDGVSNLDEFKAGTDPIDTTKPTVVSATATESFNRVNITFSEELDPASATTTANYTFSPALNVVSATYQKKVVTLTTAAQTPGAIAYTVNVAGVKDTSKNDVPAGSKAVFYSYLLGKEGALKISVWRSIPGTPVQGLYEDPRYPASPDATGAVFSFNSREYLPTDSLENYGATIEGYITPTESGSYDFFLRSDDASELYLSTDDKPENVALIAEETGCCKAFLEPGAPTTTGSPIALTAGRKYFVRVVYKEGGGGDYAQVAWRKTTDTTGAGSLRPIPGQFLSSATDLPGAPEGAFTTRIPAPNAKGVSPATRITIAHRDGKTPWTADNVSLKLNGVAVPATITKVGTVLTLDYAPPTLLPSGSVNTISLGYRDPGGNPATLESTFTVQAYAGPTRDKVGSYPAILAGKAVYTEDKGGATGKAGDYAINLTRSGGPVVTFDSKFLEAANSATAADELTVAFWQKKLDIADSSAFTLNSPTTPNQRGFHAHVPWSNQQIYFDTVGCCDGTTQRINGPISDFPDYTGDASWWTNQWHFFTFTKKGSAKNIYINGKLFLSGDNTAKLPTDHNAFYMGSGGGGAELSRAIIDDFSVYSKALTEADVANLAKGTLPSALPASKGLIAYWDFNDYTPPAPPTSPILNGLVAHWSFDGHLYDSVKDFDGTARGRNPVAFVDGMNGFGKALKLDGTDQFVEITGGNENDLEFPGKSMSIAGWFKVDAFDTSWQAILAKGEGSNYRVARRDATGTIAYAGGVGEGANDVPAVNDGNWHHFVAVSDHTGAAFGTAIYVDGVRRGVNATKPVLAANDKRLFIGENPEARNREFKGLLDDIAIWNRVVTPEEVATLYKAGQGTAITTLPGATPPIVATFARTATGITIQWSPVGGTLESSPTLGAGAVWTPVGSANPTVLPLGAGNAYYRVRQ
jgi:hypothetical protein